MDEAPDRICDWCDETSPERQARCPVKGCGTSTAPTLTEALRCPEVRELVEKAYLEGWGHSAISCGRLRNLRNFPDLLEEGRKAFKASQACAAIEKGGGHE